jgi:hypothetical protein
MGFQAKTKQAILAQRAAGLSVSAIAKLRKCSRREVQQVLDEAGAKAQPEPAQPGAPLKVETVQDVDPAPLFEAQPQQEQADSDSEPWNQEAFHAEPEPEPSKQAEPGAQPEPEPQQFTPKQVVDLFEAVCSLTLRVMVRSKGGEWSEELETACKLTTDERSRLLATAPMVAPLFSGAITNNPWFGAALFGLSAADVVLTRLELAKAATAQEAEPEPYAAPQPWAKPADAGPVVPPRG